eukprot:TRINITY_DN778_c0_g1_i1.p1 TRINITY_DN778_c0_g1~~TRINITY_DN778_c0_g1_i1.p1  ORF type:complete len:623 (+),score=133.65 TRINITY_DN778_c0_g1_i1:42-1910(+)
MGCAFSKNKHKDDIFDLLVDGQSSDQPSVKKALPKELQKLKNQLQALEEEPKAVNDPARLGKLLYFIQELHQQTHHRTTENTHQNNYWSKGTGYGHGYINTAAIDDENKKSKQEIIEKSFALLLNILENKNLPTRTVYRELESSTLHNMLISYFHNDSLLDIINRSKLYILLLKIVQIIADGECRELIYLNDGELVKLITQHSTIAAEFQKRLSQMTTNTGAEDQAKELTSAVIATSEALNGSSNGQNNTQQNQNHEQPIIEKEESSSEGPRMVSPLSPLPHPPSPPPSPPPGLDEEEDEDENGVSSGEESENDKDVGPPLSPDSSSSSVPPPPPSPHHPVQDQPPPSPPSNLIEQDANKIYIEKLKDLQFDSTPLSFNSVSTQAFAHVFSSGATNPGKMMRLLLETSTLPSSLPICQESSIFVRVDEDRIDKMKALIIGPEGTPYSGGCFEFDIYFPDAYPKDPPVVNFLTTGAGKVRFNPNLYEGGKVCLSLLGTWSGGYGETWSPQSTLLQLLVSIQSLIFVPEPFYNEPGYEKRRGTDSANLMSQNYNSNIHRYTVQHAMIEQIDNNESVFHEIIMIHFRLQRKSILSQVKMWMGEQNPTFKSLEKKLESVFTDDDQD